MASFHSGSGEDYFIRNRWLDCPKSGFVVDIGAGDGLWASNSLHFSESGWKSLLIEGDSRQFDRLVRHRPGEQCFLGVVSDVSGQTTFWAADHWDHSGLLRRHASMRPVEVRALTVDEILAAAYPDDRPAIDVMSIDTEGTDYSIWMSAQHLRPATVIIEHEHTSMSPDKIAKDSPEYRLVWSNYTNMILFRNDIRAA